MSDDATTAATTAQTGDALIVIVPPEVRERFPDIIDLILASESMNNTERQYWVDILPVMNEEQVQQLRTILTNERDQLAAIDAKYAKNIQTLNTASIEETNEKRSERREELSSKEQAARTEEERAAEDILKQID